MKITESRNKREGKYIAGGWVTRMEVEFNRKWRYPSRMAVRYGKFWEF